MSTQPIKVEVSPLVSFSGKNLEKMSRREYQNPPLKQTSAKRPQWYIRVRKRVVEAAGVRRREERLYLGFVKQKPNDDGLGLREAERERQKALDEINNQLRTIASHIRVGELVDLYVKNHLPTLGKGTQAKYATHLKNHILPRFGSWRLSDLKTMEIQSFLNEKRERCGICKACRQKEACAGLAWWTRTDLRNILSGLFTKAEAWGYWKEPYNPVERAHLERKKVRRPKKILSDEDCRALLKLLPPNVDLMLRLIDSTGMRISEVIGLRWQSVHLDEGWIDIDWRVYRGDEDEPKTERSKRPAALGELVEEFRRMYRQDKPQPHSFVFHTGGGRSMDYSNLRRSLTPAAKKLGVYFPGFGFHSFRRGFITGVQSSGGSAIEAQQMAGHSRAGTTFEYTILQRDRQQQITKERQARLAEPKKPKK